MTTGTATNNGYKHLLLEHQELMLEISELRRWWFEVQQLGIPRYGEMGSRLRTLHNQLQAHFAEEEAGGYMADVLAVAPHLANRADELRGQHRQCLEMLNAYIEKLQAKVPQFSTWDETRQQLDKILLALRQHESAENAMIHTVMNRDTPASD